jgi:Transposase DDE domain group 1
MLAEEKNFAGLAAINRERIARVEAIDSPQRIVLDMDPTEIPVYGRQEQSAYNGHFESTSYHPLLLFKREGDGLAVKLRPGNVQSAEGWEELLVPAIERQQQRGKEVVFRADAAFAKPEIYETACGSDPRRVCRGTDACRATRRGGSGRHTVST